MEVHASWLVPTSVATVLWAASDVCCDGCIRTASGGAQQRRLSPEQHAFICSVVLLVCSSAALWSRSQLLDGVDLKTLLAAGIAGALHFFAHLATVHAFQTSDSTVVTPLLQLSALVILPCHAFLVLCGAICHPIVAPVHASAVLLIVFGGMLPAWQQAAQRSSDRPASAYEVALRAAAQVARMSRLPCVRWCMLGEVLGALYNIILHEMTYKPELEDTDVSRTMSEDAFFQLAALGSGVTAVLLFGCVPRLRSEVRSCARVARTSLALGIASSLLSALGLWIANASYASVYEPSLVNAAEGALQQLFNLLLASGLALARSGGQSLKGAREKWLGFALVAIGLSLTVQKR